MQTFWAKVTTRFQGIHHYPGAPTAVGFLEHPHRHQFHVTVHIEQFNTERDVEYILFQRWLDRIIRTVFPQGLGPSSCEFIASEIGGRIELEYPKRRYKVEVLEDGENGALLEVTV